MSEEQVKYVVNVRRQKERTELNFLAKRLGDIAADIEKLSDEDKRFVIEKVDQQKSYVLAELYNALLEYME